MRNLVAGMVAPLDRILDAMDLDGRPTQKELAIRFHLRMARSALRHVLPLMSVRDLG
jgi:hypothetical protein